MKTERPAWKISLHEVLTATGGRLRSQVADVFSGVGTDTRTDLRGQIFIALKGENFDAHNFLPKAIDAGAAGILTHRSLDELNEEERKRLEGVTVIEVSDTLKALQDLGRHWRRKMKAKVLGLTGSNGKTTTKEFAAALIGSKYDVHYSKGSFNNHWGVPMTLLALDEAHEVAIVEMGMNHPGELTALNAIAEPDVVMVTMVGRGHLEGLGSIDGVARAKAEIYESAPSGATMIFNLENDHTRDMYEKLPDVGVRAGKAEALITFAGSEYTSSAGLKPDVALEVIEMEPESLRIRGRIRDVEGEVTVPVFGVHNVTNLMAASALALSSGMTAHEIWKALPLCRTAWGRNQWVRLQSGARVLFDGYNANPESMRAALENFARLKWAGRKFALLGEMREMGDHTDEVHRELGAWAAAAGLAGIGFFGPSGDAFKLGASSIDNSKTLFISDSYEQGLAQRALPVLDENDIVLIKGSRGMELEKALLDLQPIDFQAK